MAEEPEPPRNQPQARDIDRLTVILQVHHQATGEEALTRNAGFSSLLEWRAQPYERRRQVGQEAVPLADGSWLEKPGMVLIENKTAASKLLTPSPEQLAAVASAVVEVTGKDGSVTIVRPGRAMLFEPDDVAEWSLRCRAFDVPASVVVTIFPR